MSSPTPETARLRLTVPGVLAEILPHHLEHPSRALQEALDGPERIRRGKGERVTYTITGDLPEVATAVREIIDALDRYETGVYAGPAKVGRASRTLRAVSAYRHHLPGYLAAIEGGGEVRGLTRRPEEKPTSAAPESTPIR